MKLYGEDCTDEELTKFLDFDSVEDMLASADGKRGVLFITTCAGQWMKYETSNTWTFSPEPEE